MTQTRDRSAFAALLHQRCPRCREGKMFQNWVDTYKSCPVCHLVFERERGYFIGAMYFSYALAIPFVGLFLLLWYLLLPDLHLWLQTLLAIITFLPFVPMLYRYSRVLWLYFDRWAWPDS